MNWKEINKKYPKAFDLFFEWFKGDPKAGVTKKEFLEVNDIVIMLSLIHISEPTRPY